MNEKKSQVSLYYTQSSRNASRRNKEQKCDGDGGKAKREKKDIEIFCFPQVNIKNFDCSPSIVVKKK